MQIITGVAYSESPTEQRYWWLFELSMEIEGVTSMGQGETKRLHLRFPCLGNKHIRCREQIRATRMFADRSNGTPIPMAA